MNLLSLLFGQKTGGAPERVKEVSEPTSPAGVKWTDAQLKFLSGFLNSGEFKEEAQSYWSSVLERSPSKMVQCMIDAGLLGPASLNAKLDSAFNAAEIKALLRERSLPVSGRKASAITRLVEADAPGMETKVGQITAYICTKPGRALAEAYLKREEENKRRARERSFQLICIGSLREAGSVVAEYERAQVFARGLGVDWNQRPSQEDVQQLEAILKARPAILKDVAEADWSALQRAAAMMELWGERSGRAWLSETFVGASNLDPDTAIRMVLFAGGHSAKLEQYRHAGCSRVEISTCGDASCPACQKLGGKKHPISQAPELPHPSCTHEMGCRCLILPVFE